MGKEWSIPTDENEPLDFLVLAFFHDDLQLPRESVRAIVSETIYSVVADESFLYTTESLVGQFSGQKDEFSQNLLEEIKNEITRYSRLKGIEVLSYEGINDKSRER